MTAIAGSLFIFPALADRSLNDLEERVAQLEASTARSGGRRVSVSVYGQINRAILIWDDDRDSDAYVVDNDTSSTRMGFIGTAKLKDGWTAGYRIEIEYKDAASDEVMNGNDEGSGESHIYTRHASWYIDSENNGRLTVGQQSPATDDITIINLGASMSDAGLHYNNDFAIKAKNGPVTNFTWRDLAHTVDTYRGDFVRYDTPIVRGFLASVSWGENDIWDIALRYQAAWNDIRFASGIGYMDSSELNFADVKGSLSAIHATTGMFISAAAATRDQSDNNYTGKFGEFSIGEDSYFYFLQTGLSKQWFAPGKTSIYGEYGVYSNYNVGQVWRGDLGRGVVNLGATLDNEVERWGLGVEQAIDEAAVLLYANLNYYAADVTYCKTPWKECAASQPGAPKSRSLPVDDWGGVVVGARVQF